MEERFAKLYMENEQLRREKEEKERISQQLFLETQYHSQRAAELERENTVLKERQTIIDEMRRGLGTEEIEKQMEQSYATLNNALNSGDDAEIERALGAVREANRSHLDMKTQMVQKLVSPAIQADLSILEKSPIEQLMESHCKKWQFMLEEIGLTAEQIEGVREVKIQHQKRIDQLLAEREKLNKSIRNAYSTHMSSCGEVAPVETKSSIVLELTNQLSMLRDNVAQEGQFQAVLMDSLRDILTPQQEAVFALKRFDYVRNHNHGIRLLNELWSIVSTENATQ